MTGRERPYRTQVLSVKASEADAEAIRPAANSDGLTISEYMRAATLLHMVLGLNPYASREVKRGAVRVAVKLWERVRPLVLGREAKA